MPVGPSDFIDYIFKFPDQGSFLRDPVIQPFAPSINGSTPGVQLLIYNPVETLQPPVPPIPTNLTPTGNALVVVPQLANSTVALAGFWVMVTVQGGSKGSLLLEDATSHLLLEGGGRLLLENPPTVIPALANHPNIQIVNDRTAMFAQNPSVISTKIDISHINIIINIYGVYVRDGLRLM